MILDITEKEREFLERMCIREEVFLIKGLFKKSYCEETLEDLRELKEKFRNPEDR